MDILRSKKIECKLASNPLVECVSTSGGGNAHLVAPAPAGLLRYVRNDGNAHLVTSCKTEVLND